MAELFYNCETFLYENNCTSSLDTALCNKRMFILCIVNQVSMIIEQVQLNQHIRREIKKIVTFTLF
jgi:hypothetical protein